MRTVTYRLADLNRAVIPLGFVGENQHTRVIFDASKVFAEYPAAVPALTVQPPQGTSYPAVVVRDGDYVQFDVSDSDLIHAGTGELQLAFEENAVKVRTFIARTRIDRSIVPTGEIPEPLEDFLEAASAAVAAIPDEVEAGVDAGFGAVTADAETLAAGSDATAEFNTETKMLTIGVPVGADGHDGDPGADGFSPVASVSKSGDTATISITDKTGTTTATVKDGTDGQPGADGYSPSASVSKSGATATITITDKSGTTTATVSDGTPVIDDTTTTATDKVWSAKKSADTASDLNAAIQANRAMIADAETSTTAAHAHAVKTVFILNNKLLMALSAIAVGDTITTTGETPNAAEVTLAESFPHDVQVNGTSVVTGGVANVPIAGSSTLGTVMVDGSYGISFQSITNKTLALAAMPDGFLKAGTSRYKAITPEIQHGSAFYGLAKAAGADMASLSSVTVGQYPEAQRIAIQKMLGSAGSGDIAYIETSATATREYVFGDYFVDADGILSKATDDIIVGGNLALNVNYEHVGGNGGIVEQFNEVELVASYTVEEEITINPLELQLSKPVKYAVFEIVSSSDMPTQYQIGTDSTLFGYATWTSNNIRNVTGVIDLVNKMGYSMGTGGGQPGAGWKVTDIFSFRKPNLISAHKLSNIKFVKNSGAMAFPVGTEIKIYGR